MFNFYYYLYGVRPASRVREQIRWSVLAGQTIHRDFKTLCNRSSIHRFFEEQGDVWMRRIPHPAAVIHTSLMTFRRIKQNERFMVVITMESILQLMETDFVQWIFKHVNHLSEIVSSHFLCGNTHTLRMKVFSSLLSFVHSSRCSSCSLRYAHADCRLPQSNLEYDSFSMETTTMNIWLEVRERFHVCDRNCLRKLTNYSH